MKYDITEHTTTGSRHTAAVRAYVCITFSCDRPQPSARSRRNICKYENMFCKEGNGIHNTYTGVARRREKGRRRDAKKKKGEKRWGWGWG